MSNLNTKTANHIIDVLSAPNVTQPVAEDLRRWAELALTGQPSCELCIQVMPAEAIQALNQQFRHKNQPTNVLSFPADPIIELDLPYLGDIALCAEVINSEAIEQAKAPEAHWAHMVIHGTLHLLGYDHEMEADANKMELKEITLLKQLGFPNPYKEV